MTMYEKFFQLGIDGRWIGLKKSDICMEYFCTPVNATVIGWENSIHYCFIHNAMFPEQKVVLDKIRSGLKLTPMENPYEYVKTVQEQHDDSKIKFSNDYYDTLGLERPDGSENDVQYMEFSEVTFSFVKREK